MEDGVLACRMVLDGLKELGGFKLQEGAKKEQEKSENKAKAEKFQNVSTWGARARLGAAARRLGRPRQAWGGRASSTVSARILFSSWAGSSSWALF